MATWGNTLIGQGDYVSNAVNRARAQYDAGKDAVIRQAGRMGINPNSGAFMNMLNNAQYEQTAGVNAAANDAQFKWLSAAQDQFNRDRDAEMKQQSIDNANNQYWTSLNEARRGQKAQYLHEKGMFDEWRKAMQDHDDKMTGKNTAQTAQQPALTAKQIEQKSWIPWTMNQWGVGAVRKPDYTSAQTTALNNARLKRTGFGAFGYGY